MYHKMSLGEITRPMLEDCARLYCEIWKEPPWNEDFWKEDEALRDIEEQSSQSGFEMVLAVEGNHVIGFSWGYLVSREDLRKISSSSGLDYLFEKSNDIFYIDELAVAKMARGRKIGQGLSREIIESFRLIGGIAVLRTDESALPARNLYKSLGFEELPVRDGKYLSRTYWKLDL